jgi:ribosomal protein S18 acetylase RimI-like enzyme
MKYQLRKASHADLVPLMRIGHEGIRPYVESLLGWDSQEQERRFREDFHPEQISVIQFEDRVVGYLKVEDKSDHIFLAGIYLSKSVRSVGLGSSIIADLVATARSSGKSIRLQVMRTNPAQSLYQRLGFNITGNSDTHIFMESSAA